MFPEGTLVLIERTIFHTWGSRLVRLGVEEDDECVFLDVKVEAGDAGITPFL